MKKSIKCQDGGYMVIDEPTATINILGTNYHYEETTSKADSRLCNKDGFCDEHGKVILVETDYNENDPDSIKDYDAFKAFAKRHEIVHAYFAESGLLQYSDDERLVSWIAWQFPKILKTFDEVNAIKH